MFRIFPLITHTWKSNLKKYTPKWLLAFQVILFFAFFCIFRILKTVIGKKRSYIALFMTEQIPRNVGVMLHAF